MAVDPTFDLRRRFTVEEYELMGRTGILGEDDRTELLAGEIVHGRRRTPSPDGARVRAGAESG
jgi:hypothetical protein